MSSEMVFSNLPSFSSPIIGRERELARLQHLLRDTDVRFITIIGVPGIGKTRLVSALAESFTQDKDREGRFISLAQIHSPDLVIPEIAKGFEIQSDQPQRTLSQFFREWHGLLILDNFEQVVEAAPDVAKMIPSESDVKVLVTSQQPLGLEAEQIFRLLPLPVPDGDTEVATNPCVQLLINRAVAQDRDTVVSETSVEVVGDICRRLDGIPLAIELAAPRLISLGPEALLSQLEQGQQFLSSLRRDRPERQRSMHSAIAWSVHLLAEDVQRIFRWMGAFAGGFDLPLLQSVINHLYIDGDPTDVVTELINFSLLQRVSGGATPWFTMLASIRDFCLQELVANEERDEAEAFVAGYVHSIGARSEAELTSSGAEAWSTRLERELPTIRSAIRWSLDHQEAELPMFMADGLWRFMEQYGASNEVLDWIRQAEAWPDTAAPRTRTAALLTKLLLENERRDLDEGFKTAAKIEQLLSIYDFPDLQVRFDVYMGHMAKDSNDLDEAFRRYASALTQASTPEMSRWAAVAEGSLGVISYMRGDFGTAEANWNNVVTILEERNDLMTLAGMYSNLVAAANDQGAFDRSLEYADKGIVIIRSLDLKRELLYSLLNQSEAYLELGEVNQARINLEEALDLARSLDVPILLATAHINMAFVHLAESDLASVSASAIEALRLLTFEEGQTQYLSISRALATALVKQSRPEDAAALLGKTVAFASEAEIVFSQPQLLDIARLWDAITANCEQTDQHRERGAAWNAATWLRNLDWFARSIAPSQARSSGMLVSIPPVRDLPQLTHREEEVLQLLINGYSTHEMADHLSVSPRTVTTHLAHIMNKMNVSSRTELLATVLRSRG